MPDRINPCLARAFELAHTGRYEKLDDIILQLMTEGHRVEELRGELTLTLLERTAIREAKKLRGNGAIN